MATSKKEVRHGTAQAKVNDDDDMLRTGFINGTPLEAGKIADSQPVDLFAQARRVFSDAGRVAQANNNNNQQQVGREGMAEPTAGGRQA